jgi:hypothetical protein
MTMGEFLVNYSTRNACPRQSLHAGVHYSAVHFGVPRHVSQRPIYVCEICQTVLDEHHCKAICPNCGRMLDCSDLPGIQANAIREDDGAVTPRKGWERDFIPRQAPKTETNPDRDDSGGVANLP